MSYLSEDVVHIICTNLCAAVPLILNLFWNYEYWMRVFFVMHAVYLFTNICMSENTFLILPLFVFLRSWRGMYLIPIINAIISVIRSRDIFLLMGVILPIEVVGITKFNKEYLVALAVCCEISIFLTSYKLQWTRHRISDAPLVYQILCYVIGIEVSTKKRWETYFCSKCNDTAISLKSDQLVGTWWNDESRLPPHGMVFFKEKDFQHSCQIKINKPGHFVVKPSIKGVLFCYLMSILPIITIDFIENENILSLQEISIGTYVIPHKYVPKPYFLQDYKLQKNEILIGNYSLKKKEHNNGIVFLPSTTLRRRLFRILIFYLLLHDWN